MSEPAMQQNVQNDVSELPVGEILRRTRLHYERSIEDVERALHIQPKQIQAIEAGDMEALPARVYAIGFVRSYAEYLGLDGDKIVELFKAQTQTLPPKADLSFPEGEVQSNMPPLGVILIIAALLLMALAFTFTRNDEDAPPPAEAQTIPEVPEELTVQALEEKQAAVIAAQQEPEPEPAKQEGIVLKMVSDSWVEIRDVNKRKLISRVLKAGDQYFVPDRLDLSMSIGNAGGVEILVDGDPLENIGKSGEVLRNIPLNAEALLIRFPRAQQNTIETSEQNQ